MDECDFENGVENCFWEKLEWKSHFRPVSVWIVAGMKSLKISTRRLPVWRVVLSCGVRACGALFYRVFAGSDFLAGSVKNRQFLRKWCSKWCNGMQDKICHRGERAGARWFAE